MTTKLGLIFVMSNIWKGMLLCMTIFFRNLIVIIISVKQYSVPSVENTIEIVNKFDRQ